MVSSIVWISGASRGIGEALVRTVPWEDTRVIGISRSSCAGCEHLAADLARPESWSAVAGSFRRELEGFDGHRAVFVHAAGSLDPVGFARSVDPTAYAGNVMLNSASAQVLGQAFLAAASDVAVERHLVMLTSGAASSVYPGWTAYGAAKAAVDQWVRNAGAEEGDDGVRVLAVAPGTVDTDMQAVLRQTDPGQFPQRQKFVDLHAQGKLTDPTKVAVDIWALLDAGLDNGSVVDLRKLTGSRA